ncbi:MAG: hypothetical protein J6V11_03470, partial [Alphaproteobacteria bacterium]|nr:hypothetical protein [Alphaproteobacteria bacterium]
MKFDILHKKKAQAGYTMFETIGALGLLSLLLMGSIRGIQYSSDRLHANELNNEIMQRAADIKMQLDRPHAKVKWSKWEAKSHTGCPIEFSQNTEEVTIQVLNIKQRVCEMVLTDLSHLEGASRVEGNCSSSADNTLVFYFDKLGAKKRIKKEDCFCDEPKVCDENGDCVCSETSPIGYDPDTCNCPSPLVPIKGKCLCEDETEPIDGVCGDCSSDEDCSGGKTCENHVCTCIAKECSGSDFTDTLCACCPTETPKWDDVEGACKTCADIDINLPVYNKDTKTCEACPDNKIWDSVSGQCVECVVDSDCAASGFVCANNVCACAEGASMPCAASLKQTTNTSKYNQICYICTCPTGSTMSGDTCVCNNECQTYNTSTKTCVSKTDGTTCSTGLCKTGVCTNDTCTTGVKTCASDYTKTQVATTAYGTACYQCCASPKVWNGTACACPSGTPTYANASTCACNSGETNKNGVCTPDLYSSCATYCQTRNSTSSGTFKNCRDTTTTSKLNLVLYLQHTVSSTGAKTYTLVSQNTYNGQTATYTYKLGTGSTYFETECEYGYATYNGSY